MEMADKSAKGYALKPVAKTRALLACTVVVVTALFGCVTVGVHTTGAGSVEDLEAENAYVDLYMDHMTQIAKDLRVFAPSGDNPGPCNKGGIKQDCHDADTRAIATMTAMLDALNTARVPPRFVDADKFLREALIKNSEGLRLRNQALETGDDGIWAKHAAVLDEAQTIWAAAYAAFPTDHRPPIGP